MLQLCVFFPTIKLFKVGLGCGFGFIECVFLTPKNNFRGAELLNDPMADFRIIAGIQKYVCDVFAQFQTCV